MVAEEDDEIGDYLDEARSYIDELNEKLLVIEGNPAVIDSDPAVLKDTFRAAHSLKGLSAAFGFSRTNELIHKVEHVLDELRHDTIRIDSELLLLLYKATDRIDELFDDIAHSKTEKTDVEGLMNEIAAGLATAVANAAADGGGGEAVKASAEAVVEAQTPGAPAASAVGETVRVGLDRLDRLMNLTGELVVARSRILTLTQELGKLPELADSGMRAVAVEEIEKVSGVLSAAVADLETVTNGIQTTVMEVRMVSLDPVFRRFQRTVRDVATQMGKKINLVLLGTDTELDKRVTDELVNPLTHLVRNAADHGLESPEERLAAGKPETGTVTLRGSQRGSHVLIEVIDDGRGISSESLKERAVSKGVISRDEANKMTEAEALRLIFKPGFTTAEQVTDISGRGMGMDIVQNKIEGLRGVVDVQSTAGVGSRFAIKLPLTLSILTCLLVKVRGEIYAVPLASIQELISVSASDRLSVVDQDVVMVRDQAIGLVRLDKVLRFHERLGTAAPEEDPARREREALQVVIVHAGEGRVGIVVDELLRKEDLVVKPLSGEIAVRGLSGSAILGDGRVTLIIDPGNLAMQPS